MRIKGNLDFTPSMYRRLLEALRAAGYLFRTFEEFTGSTEGRIIVLRHDVDRRPLRSLRLAEVEAEAGISGSYHFRVAGSSNDPGIIKEIAGLGHEIGYHYEDMTRSAALKSRGRAGTEEEIAAAAFQSFRSNLEYFRQYYPVRVISMHGSPTGRIDNRLIWKYYDYRECGIICEPYFDIDFSRALYLTDTGRRWDGEKYSVRDRAVAADSRQPAGGFTGWKVRPLRGSLLGMTDEGQALKARFRIHSTKEILKLAESGHLPEMMVINTHPQRWNDSSFQWVYELCTQSVKNHVKKLVIRLRAGRAIN